MKAGAKELSVTRPASPAASVAPATPATATEATLTSEPPEPGARAASAAPAGVATWSHDPDRYVIVGEHGRGGLGKVTRVHDRALGRDVAIKELISRGQVSEVRFLREALITARLEHPGIVPVHEAGRWPDGTPFYAMKLVAGRALRELIAEAPTVDQRLALLPHVVAVADAIAYAHGRGVIHRDLKPANVIVGDFGETVVIDWGLAKDLAASDDGAAGAGGPRGSPGSPGSPGSYDDAPRDDGLTTTGSVLGTPAYMAPEQQRGERVDRRADVFALGAMLWELCALDRVPPADSAVRRRRLRRAGIDGDLATIIDKALATDPEQRYPDAGALADDLEAFESGARIAARRYSLPAMLAHWARRNRRLALSALAAIALAAGGSAVFVHNLAAERDRADRAHDDLAAKHVELLLASDPSAAGAALADYHGPDRELASLLRAKAEGLGIAVVRAAAHKETIYFLQPLADGSLLSISEGGTVVVTSIDGRSRALATDAAIRGATAFSAARGQLFYACRPGGICAIDPLHAPAHPVAQPRTIRPAPGALGDGVPASLDVSPDGAQLIALYGDRIALWDIAGDAASVRAQLDAPGASQVFFAAAGRAVAVAAHRVYLVDLAAGRVAPPVELDATAIASDGERVIAGNEHGEVVQLPIATWPAHEAPRPVCERRVNALAVLHTRPVLAYACQDGEVGLRGLADGALVAQVSDGNAAIALAVSADDRYVVFGGQHGVLRIYDAATDRFASYKGQIACLDAVAAPSAAFPYVAAGDDDGTLRVWAPPTPVARTVISAVAMLYDTAIFDDGTVVGAGGDRELRWWRNGQGGAVAAHDGGAIALRRSRDGAHVASFGSDGDIVLWDARMAPLRRMHAGPLTGVAFLDDGASLVSTGEDGRLLWWTAETPAAQDGPAFAVQFAQPLVAVEALPWGDIVVAARGGDLWRVNPAGERQRIRQGRGEAMAHLVASSDGRWLGVGTSAGEVSVFSTATWEAMPVVTADGPIRSVALSPDASLIAAVSKTGVAYLAPHPAMPAAAPPGWRQIAVPARDAKFSPDGRLLAITTNDGGALFYGLRRRQWRYIPLLAPEVFRGQFSRDGAHYATVDAAGRATLFDARQIPD